MPSPRTSQRAQKPTKRAVPRRRARAPAKRAAPRATTTVTRPAASRRLTTITELGERGYVAGGRPPAPDLAGVPPVRLTAYLRPDQVVRLRSEAADRQALGQRTDMSSLLRAAVDLLLPVRAMAKRAQKRSQ